MLSPEELANLPSAKSGLRDKVEDLRKRLKALAPEIKGLTEDPAVQGISHIRDHGEAIANVMLSYRHLEDATMRLGKVLQAADGGVSILDR